MNLPPRKPPASLLDFDFAAMLRAAKTRPIRKIREFAESEIRIPEGKHAGEKLRLERQPVQGLFLDEIDSGRWSEIYVAGPSQSGKTLIAFSVPCVYFTAELQETMIVGCPDGNMANDKWVKEIRPMFESSNRLRSLLPEIGPGSKRGKVRDYLELTNFTFLRFMGRAGDDTAKAGYTAKFVLATEAAGWSSGTETSVEASPLEQLKARQMSYDDSDGKLLIVEGTVTIPEELPWSIKPFTSQSRIVSPCPHCGGWISPERDDLVGWDDAENSIEAEELARWSCPECGELIDDADRRWSVAQCKIVHGDQSIDAKGNIVGPLPPTRKLWFRWSAWHNLNVSTQTLGSEEWQCNRLEPETELRRSAEKRQCQFRFASPYIDDTVESYDLKPEKIALRQKISLPIGLLPEETTHLALGVDVGKYYCYFSFLAGCGNRLYIPRYGKFMVDSKSKDFEIALHEALVEFWEHTVLIGLPKAGSTDVMRPSQIFVDAGDGDATNTVYRAFKTLTGGRRQGSPAFLPIFGRGTSQMQRIYQAPRKAGKLAIEIGDGWHVGMVQTKQKRNRGWGGFIDVDLWKDRIHRSLYLDEGNPGSMSLYAGESHQTFARHITNEQKQKVFKENKGEVDQWKRTGQQAWLDTTVYARVALERAGWKLTT